MEPFTFATSNQLKLNVSVRIQNLEGQKPLVPYSQLLKNPELKFVGSNLSPVSDLYIAVQVYGDNKPLGVPVQTAYKSFKAARVWKEWLTLPVRYCDIPRSAQLAITIWDLGGPDKEMPYGGTTVRLFDADGTLKKGRQKLKVWLDVEADGRTETATDSIVESNDEMDRLEKQIKKHESGEIPRVDWLDNLAFRQIEQIQKKSIKRTHDHFLYIDFPRFDFPVVFCDFEYPTLAALAEAAEAEKENGIATPTASTGHAPSTAQSGVVGSSIPGEPIPAPVDGGMMRVYDPEAARERDNPAEAKHMNLVRSQRNGPSDRDLKPNARIRDQLNDILKYPPTHELNPDEKNLIWKFRYYLTRDKRALTKFLKSVVWADAREVKGVLELLPKWAEVDVDDSLELLGPAFTNPAVRTYAVARLKKADDNELVLYLLQLVQALKFERQQTGDHNSESSLAQFLVTRASENETLGSLLYWYLAVEMEFKRHKKLYERVVFEFMHQLEATPEAPDRPKRSMLARQATLNKIFNSLAIEIRDMKAKREKKIEHLKNYIADPAHGLLNFEPLPLPLDPSVIAVGMIPSESNVFKSTLSPLMMTFKTADGGKYPMLFKNGDDLRQDQLVIQTFTLMDQLLRKENLDLKLSPYKILASSPTSGMIQFVASKPIATIVREYKTILEFLKHHYPDGSTREGVKAEVLDNYVKSCAGYCVITYILGVGDRHLDNLLVTPDGFFFHADFGFILGHDPKIFAPQMKLCKEMVDGMGGSDSVLFKQFKGYCYTAFSILRKNASLILNLWTLMIDAGIPDVEREPDTAVLKIQEKFWLESGEEEALGRFEVLIGDSLNALFPIVIDRMHNITQYWKS
ncbi:Phosphatidylinositol (PI) 3-kinase [Orbilia oligospora]|uniref:Phosphatidylinositol 3-kinase VPS34 n=1 Tax=Orbilia oligospora TaxID=2813651 RepID=A0A7C8N7W5_ORBOL|nr:Phosphatidylinositol (PI) 3-kinase [Orbilia oligospora]KAF3108803.1 Phosphatidylinositol (PI) 3-kinase [Orbilia oligospora]KAF3126319.1 Phosphatidylinositol (PI) 3-kinase [Orbilia oligospora]KAF3129327.1 Phosphatidylinositol (PI) 3-kinase [Orbilia oligospora]KAF3150959.1 Phosphatidylinositol (PI) 3-kinase [Orbilia oligospora]